MYYIGQGDFGAALGWVFNDYLGYGIVWLLIGVAIFSTTQQQSKSYAIGGLVISMFFAAIGSQLPVEVQGYFTVLVGLLLFAVFYKVVR